MMEQLDQHLYFMPFLCGVVFLVLAGILYKWPPRKINALYGYRTPSSMKNQQRWDFAQAFSTKRMLEAGAVMILSSLLKMVLPEGEMNEVFVGFTVLFLSAVYMIVTTERALKDFS